MSLTIHNLRATEVFTTYWRFASKRHTIFERRLRGEPPPWTEDPILSKHKFTNAFRAADRVSQYCIKQVIYGGGSSEPAEVVFRILLFKLFNSIPAWEILNEELGPPTWKTFEAAAYSAALMRGKARRGVSIWNAAYMQNQMYRTDLKTKHERYLALVEHMMRTGVTNKLQSARTYEDAFKALHTYPLHGDVFVPMQHLTDLNYSEVINFDEDDFIVPGPGALRGINKCFGLALKEKNPQDLKIATDIIERCVITQEDCFKNVGEQPVTLFGRRLHAIDCQNLFCEVDKYARVAHPQFNLKPGARIKQTLKPTGPLPKPFFPPKWGLP
jgi:hypothetical protein